jgi:hypothetical protein
MELGLFKESRLYCVDGEKAPFMTLLLTPLTPADLDTLVEGPRKPQNNPPQTLRDVHHMMARMFAMGLRTGQVSERMGYTFNRVSTIRNSPAFEALIQTYRNKLDEAFVERGSDYFALLGENGLRAERMIADRLEEAMEGGDDAPVLSTKDLLAISRDSADRIGFGKRQTNVNLNADFAALLDKAVSRSRDAMKTIDGAVREALPVPKLQRRA